MNHEKLRKKRSESFGCGDVSRNYQTSCKLQQDAARFLSAHFRQNLRKMTRSGRVEVGFYLELVTLGKSPSLQREKKNKWQKTQYFTVPLSLVGRHHIK